MTDEVLPPEGGFLNAALRPAEETAARFVLDLGTAAMAAPPVSAGGGFLVDPERAEACVAELRRVGERLSDASYIALQARAVDPPGADVVSANVAAQARLMSDRAHEYVTRWQAQIGAAADALEEQVKAYERADQGNAGRV